MQTLGLVLVFGAASALCWEGGARVYAEKLFARGPLPHPAPGSRPNLQAERSSAAAYTVEVAAGTAPFTHFFELSVGSGHIALSARADYRAHLSMAARDCGFKYVRGHGLLDDDMDVSKGRGQNSFYNVDQFVEFLLSIGMKPILELSFMPSWLANGTSTVCHYNGNNNPPNSYADWQELMRALAQHLVDRFGLDTVAQFYFEVWNEPNAGFWKGSQQEYFQLYQHAAAGIKSVSERLRVGGPAACCSGPNCWLTDFMQFCNRTGTPFDFVSSHDYSSGSFDGSGVGDVNKVVDEAHAARGFLGPVQWLITEYGASFIQGVGDHFTIGTAYHDMIDQASYTVAVVDKLANAPGAAMEPQALSYWAFSDVFEENFFPVANESFHGMFGLINLHGVPKPTYRAYQLLHETGDQRYTAVSQTSASGLCSNTSGVLAVKNNTSSDILVYNHAGYAEPIETCEVIVVLKGLSHGVKATVRRIDEDHANPVKAWVGMGAPDYTTAQQNEAIFNASVLVEEQLAISNTAVGVQFTVTVPPHGIAAVHIA